MVEILSTVDQFLNTFFFLNNCNQSYAHSVWLQLFMRWKKAP